MIDGLQRHFFVVGGQQAAVGGTRERDRFTQRNRTIQIPSTRFFDAEIVIIGIPAGCSIGVVIEQAIADSLKSFELKDGCEGFADGCKVIAVDTGANL
jgi:hypothetical protein